MTYMPEWFVMRRGLANGVLDAGGRKSGFYLGVRLTCRSLGASAGGLILPLILPVSPLCVLISVYCHLVHHRM